MRYLLPVFLLLLVPLAMAEECIVSDQLEKLDGKNVEGVARRLLGNEKTVVVNVNGTEYWYRIENWTATRVEPGEADLRITTDACTIKDISEGRADAAAAFEEAKIEVEAETFGSKIRLGIAKIVYAIYEVFS